MNEVAYTRVVDLLTLEDFLVPKSLRKPKFFTEKYSDIRSSANRVYALCHK